ncbi:M56 family metallopeptidase [Haliscomenobacter sp.]|uniref:M56 family metallopeptidase n=1 Tax=Haliscomenobacter sp. TaxID=2717303 RepID=UPI003BAD9784
MINPALTYCLTTAAILVTGALLYYLCFLKSTFLNWNRRLLWGLLLASLVVPLIQVPETWTIWHKMPVKQSETLTSRAGKVDKGVQSLLEQEFSERVQISIADQSDTRVGSEPAPEFQLNWFRLTLWLYGLGCLAFGLRFVLQILSLWKLYHQARIEQRDGYRLVIYPGELSPFAFGRCIFIAASLYRSPELELVLTHELAHIRQRHTLDILAAELLLVWQWFNPGAWLYRWLVETNLEYLADRSVLQQQWNKKHYQLSLLTWANINPGNHLSTSYNFSRLKERIMMMNRKPSSNLYLLRYAAMGMLLPTFILFNKPSQARVTVKAYNQSAWQALDNKPVFEQPTMVNLPAPKFSETALVKNKAEQRIPIAQDTAKEEEISFMLIVNPNLDADQQEKIRNEKFPLGKKLELTKNSAGRITGARMVNESGGNCYTSHEANDDLPIVLYGGRNSCGTGTFDTDVLDKLIANQWPKTMKVMTYGIPSDPLLLEAYRIKILAAKRLYDEEHLKFLASKNWIVYNSNSSTTYRMPVKEDSWSRVKKQIQAMVAEGKPYAVIVNGYTYQSELPSIELSKIAKMIVYDEMKTEYIEGTLNVKKYEKSGLRVEITLE